MSAGLAEVLAEHPYATVDGCGCGWTYPPRSGGRLHDEFLAHVAAAVTEWLGERLREAREDVAEAIDDAHTWDDGEWSVVTSEATDAALSVVAAALGVTDEA